MENDLYIRAAKNEDCAQVRELIFGILREYGLQPDLESKDRDLDDLEGNYFNRNGFFGVAVNRKENRIIGTFGLAYKDPETCELRKMYLLKTERGKGLGKMLLSNAIEIARQKKYKTIFLETVTPLKEAIALYRKFGFVEIAPTEVNKRCNMAFELALNG